jgi:hypothetical protein
MVQARMSGVKDQNDQNVQLYIPILLFVAAPRSSLHEKYFTAELLELFQHAPTQLTDWYWASP